MGRDNMPSDAITSANIYPCLFYENAPAAIEWLCDAFGFVKRLVVAGPHGTVVHSELSFGPGIIMVGTASPKDGWVSPRNLPGVNQLISVQVDDPDAHFARATSRGAVVTRPLRDEDYGSRGYMVKDLEGNHWCFATYRPGRHWTEGAGAASAT